MKVIQKKKKKMKVILFIVIVSLLIRARAVMTLYLNSRLKTKFDANYVPLHVEPQNLFL